MAKDNETNSMQQQIDELKRMLQEKDAALAKATAPKVDEFSMSITEFRAPGTRGAQDKGSKGGSLALAFGKSAVYPSKQLVKAILDNVEPIKEFLTANEAKISR